MDINLLMRLSNAFGPPGLEDEPRDILKAELEDFSDETSIDVLGNIIFRHIGEKGKPLIMLAAHMDEVGFMVTHIDDAGFLRIHSFGVVANLLPGQRLIFKGRKTMLKGIIGTKPPHIMSEAERIKPIVIEDLFVDIGADDREQAEKKGAFVGMRGVFDVEFVELGDGYIRGKAFDDRTGCYVLAETFKWLKDKKYNVAAVGTVQEEVGTRGAKTSAYAIDPHFGLAVEGTFAVDMPGMQPHLIPASLHKGPVVTIVDASVIVHPKILDALTSAGDEEKIPYQFKKIPSGGTDAGSISLSRAGVPSGTVAVPNRYIHGPAAVTTIEDIENTVKLVQGFIRTISV
jgi:putative aminopeptidase FrvX